MNNATEYARPGYGPGAGAKVTSAGNRRAQSTTRRPPYARSIRPGARDLRAFAGNWRDAAQSAGDGRATVLCPPDADPGAYDWSCCGGADVFLRWRAHEADPDTVQRLAVLIVQAGAELVLTCETTGHPDHPMQAYRPREVARAA